MIAAAMQIMPPSNAAERNSNFSGRVGGADGVVRDAGGENVGDGFHRIREDDGRTRQRVGGELGGHEHDADDDGGEGGFAFEGGVCMAGHREL
jgi:hypothetical protein